MNYKEYFKANKEELDKIFKFYYPSGFSDAVDMNATEDELECIDNGDMTEEEWYEQFSERASFSAEWNAAFQTLKPHWDKFDKDGATEEEVKGYLIEYLEYSTKHFEKQYYTEE